LMKILYNTYYNIILLWQYETQEQFLDDVINVTHL